MILSVYLQEVAECLQNKGYTIDKGTEDGLYLMSVGGYVQLLDPMEVAEQWENEYIKHHAR